ncbi:sialate:O-sulfotransferase 1-like [Daphnia carinata]|uniref:sialate:O-sulfotransferase 1-like n=1 Tax=Daphnia carinata TaxID=120202 RepID=UPI00257CCE66|nr:sialate:O-sulfotransferase 1-like [Daphnia carinata]
MTVPICVSRRSICETFDTCCLKFRTISDSHTQQGDEVLSECTSFEMKLRRKELYAIALATAGVALFSLHRLNYEGSHIVSSIIGTFGNSWLIAGKEKNFTLPPDYIIDPDHVSYPWIGDPTCQHFPVQFARNHTRPKWALTSFPGSGVTWTRQLIEGVTGIYTGSVYGRADKPIVLTGNHSSNTANLECECTILIKDHDIDQPIPVLPIGGFNGVKGNETTKKNDERGPVHSFFYGYRGVLLLRNPVDTMFTYAHFLATSGDKTGVVSENHFSGPNWEAYVDYVANTWADHAVGWIETIQNGTVLFYERLLLEDTAAELKRLLEVIRFSDPHRPPVDPQRLRCALRHKNRVDRKRLKKPVVPLTADQRKKFESSIERVQTSLREKGWPLLPVYLYREDL